jgi:hypothetical protein
MLVLDVWMWPRMDVPNLGLIDGNASLLRGWIVTSWLKT